jgi:hypothetical protein
LPKEFQELCLICSRELKTSDALHQVGDNIVRDDFLLGMDDIEDDIVEYSLVCL